MRIVIGEAVIKGTDQRPAKNLQCRLETFNLATNQWNKLADATTDAQGKVLIRAGLVVPTNNPAPQVRLIRLSDKAVLGEGGRLNFDRRRHTLTVDFGEIVSLPRTVNTVAANRAIAGRGMRVGGAVSGVVRENPTPVANLEPQLKALRLDIGKKEQRITSLERSLADEKKLTTRMEAETRRIPQLEAKLAEHRDVKRQLDRANAAKRDLDAALKERLAEIEKLKAPKPKTLAMSAMAANIAAEISEAQKVMSRDALGGLGLSNVRIRMKALPGDGATKVTLPDAEDLKDSALAQALADVDLTFDTDRPLDDPAPVKVPDVRRMTESAVRQVLQSLGLKLERVDGPQAAGGAAAGQAALQSPEAGSEVALGTTVTVMFAS